MPDVALLIYASLALISCFFDPKNVTESMELIDSKLEEFDIELLYWRKVPTDKEILGTMAKKSKPGIYQAIICSRKEYKYKFEKYNVFYSIYNNILAVISLQITSNNIFS